LAREKVERKRDVDEYVRQFASTLSAPDYEAERRELEKMVREAIQSREVFDAYRKDLEAARALVLRKLRLEERKRAAAEERIAAAALVREQRVAVHKEALRATPFRMVHIEQVAAVQNLKDFGVRISRLRPHAPVAQGRTHQ
jgi:hypothetical protein